MENQSSVSFTRRSTNHLPSGATKPTNRFATSFVRGAAMLFSTKGPGGKFPHHRGIYYGFSKCSYVGADGKTQKNIDTWHCRKAHQVHHEFLKQEAGADSAAFTSRIEWIDNEGKPFASEERTMTFSHEGSALIVDFDSTLKPLVPELTVDGDPQHAVFNTAPTTTLQKKTAEQTIYIRPESGEAKPGATINWSAKSDTPTNPGPTLESHDLRARRKKLFRYLSRFEK